MKHSVEVGLSFGTTSAIITTLGLMVGLYSGTNSQLAVLGGIIIIAIADALSDSFGIHISEESEGKHTRKQVWESTISTFLTKFIVAITFVVPVLLFELQSAIIASIVWGVILISALSYILAKKEREKPVNVIFSHICITIAVVAVSYLVGEFVALFFG